MNNPKNEKYGPLVSVVVPNYNYARFLKKRMESILEQTFSDIEVIYIDDASTDNSVEIAKSYSEKAAFRMHVNKKNCGSPFPLWNRGVAMARGKYVWIAESDDYAESEFLESLVNRMEEDSHLGLAYCQSRMVDENEHTVGNMQDYTEKWWPRRWSVSFCSNGREEVSRYLIHHNTIPNVSAVLFRRSAYLKSGGAASDMRLCGDWMTYVRILLNWNLFFESETLNNFRIHEQVTRKRLSGDPQEIRERYAVLREVFRNFSVKKEDLHKALESRMYFWVDLAKKRGWTLSHPEMKSVLEVAKQVDSLARLRFLKKKLIRKIKEILSGIGKKKK